MITQSGAAPEGTVQSYLSHVGLPALCTIGGALVGYLVAVLLGAVIRRATRRVAGITGIVARGRRPLRFTLMLIGAQVGLRWSTVPSHWRDITDQIFVLTVIGGVTWLVVVAVQAIGELLLERYRLDVDDNRQIRRIRTQIAVLRRIATVAIVIVGIGVALLTFPGARLAGAGVLTSAGLVSIVAGLAAQSSLANIFAGIQLAFTDAIRVDDVVVVQDQFGRIDEITLTYVVVRVWDERHLILPSTYFTTTPFQNWTRRTSQMMGTIEIDLDWTVPLEAARVELDRLLEVSERWDGRVGVLQVTDAVNSFVRLRVLVSAGDSGTLFDLRCEVREGLVQWLQREHPESLPRVRVSEISPASAGSAGGQDHRGPAAQQSGEPLPNPGAGAPDIGPGPGPAR